MLNGIFITHIIASIPSAQKQIKSGVGSRLRAECLTEPGLNIGLGRDRKLRVMTWEPGDSLSEYVETM